ncbi:MAG: hypothetical protein M1825_001341 [Sarcosagium campestre]|nr:MAG: hypothetical protein M1825_001341 [Sarcosagium campestre]
MSTSSAKILSTSPATKTPSGPNSTTYADPTGATRTWESAVRRTRPANSVVDGVGIVAVLEKPNGPELLLQKQFRPPVEKVTIEVPAGLIDPKESPETCALRELKEETGYVGEVIGDGFGVSPLMFNDPGFTNTNLNIVHIKIDMSKPENLNPKPELEESEFIESFTIPLRDLYSACRQFEKEGYAIDARVGTLAEGLEIARRWAL